MTCEEFLQTFWPNDIPGRIAIWHGETKKTSYHTTVTAASEAAMKLARRKQNVFFGVGARKPGLPPHSRGGARDVTALPALFADIDVQSVAHPNQKLPPDINTAFQIAYEIEPRPTLIIHTGGGLHLYHVLTDPIIIGDEWTTDRVGRLIRLYKDWLVGKFAPWHVDPGTFELSRVLRPAGTVRYKEDPPTEVAAMYDSGDRVSLEKLLQVIGAPSDEANSEIPTVALVDPNFMDPRIQGRIEALLSNGLAVQFAATWQRRRTDRPEWSQSEYDMAFAAHLARFEWPSEDIARALVIYRKRWKYRPDKPEELNSPKPAAYFSRTAGLAIALVSGSPITIENPERRESGVMTLVEIGQALGLEIISISKTDASIWVHLSSGYNIKMPLDSLGTMEYLRQTVSLQAKIALKPISDAAWATVSRAIKKVATPV